jgi:hypothetical protein
MPYKDKDLQRKAIMDHYYRNWELVRAKQKKYKDCKRAFDKAWKQLCNCLL